MPAANEFWIIGVLVLIALLAAGFVLLLTHLVGPKRHGERKESTYESGMEPVGDTRRRFNVRFYLIAVLFLVFGVEIVFLYPWASMFTELSSAGRTGSVPAWTTAMQSAGYTPGYIYGAVLVFFVLLVVGFVYEWRKGLFKWD
jgi:NADH-quinone oxidoreductase subunit A